MKKGLKSSFGIRLRRLRNDRGLSASEMAQALEISVSTYREWENGRAIRGEPYVKLAKILQVSLSELLTGESAEHSRFLIEFEKLEEQLQRFKEILYSSF